MIFEPPSGPERIVVKRVLPATIEQYAPKILGVLHAAYTRRFVEELEVLSQRAVNRRFDAHANEKSQAERMRASMAKGSTYWVAEPVGYVRPDDVFGVVKTSPSRAGIINRLVGEPNCYINDVDTVAEGHGIGSALLFVALGRFEDDRTAVLDAVADNPRTNNWFEQIGFRARERMPNHLEIDEERLDQVRYEAEVGVGGVRRTLIERKLWLADGFPEL